MVVLVALRRVILAARLAAIALADHYAIGSQIPGADLVANHAPILALNMKPMAAAWSAM